MLQYLHMGKLELGKLIQFQDMITKKKKDFCLDL